MYSKFLNCPGWYLIKSGLRIQIRIILGSRIRVKALELKLGLTRIRISFKMEIKRDPDPQ
jgi:hypothetical protein